VRFNADAFVPHWAMVADHTIAEVERHIRMAGWKLLSLAARLKSRSFGPKSERTMRRAVVRLIANQ
jgi:hypothetical protein